MIDNLFINLGEACNTRDILEEKYDCTFRKLKETNKTMEHLENECGELKKEVSSLKDVLEDHSEVTTKENMKMSTMETSKANECLVKETIQIQDSTKGTAKNFEVVAKENRQVSSIE